MRGLVRHAFGGNWDSAFLVAHQGVSAPAPDYEITLSTREAFLWFWGVKTLRLSWSFDDGITTTSGTRDVSKLSLLPNGVVPFTGQNLITSDHQLFLPGPHFNNEDPEVIFRFLDRPFRTAGLNDWTSWWFFDLTPLVGTIARVSSSQLFATEPAGTATFTATDLLLPFTFTQSAALYTTTPGGITGSLSITPLLWHSYNDANGNPKYSTSNGALL